MRYLVVSTSLASESRSRRLARRADARLRATTGPDERIDFLDLAEAPPPICGSDAGWADAAARGIAEAAQAADGILIGVPVYNYAAGSAAKAFVEFAGRGLEEKVVAFACAAGGGGSYMAVLPLANSLMLDFRAVIVPRYVYAPAAAFTVDPAGGEEGIADDDVLRRIDAVADDLRRMTRALRGPAT